MSKNIYISKNINLSDLKKCKNLIISEQKELYKNSGIATYKISHKTHQNEYLYVIYNTIVDNSGKIIQEIPKIGEKCEKFYFVEFENNFENVDNILQELCETLNVETVNETSE